MNELIVTNGDSAAGLLRAAGFEADILPWRDVLHDGPVPQTESLESLSVIRAAFLADAFGAPPSNIMDDFELRDRTLRQHDTYRRITLWFEHDLYDQLQLLQILDFFHGEKPSTPIHLVQANDYLGQQSPDSIRKFEPLSVVVSPDQMALAADLFAAFRQPAPIDLAVCLAWDLAPFPHMKRALRRLFEEFPDQAHGLSRTQYQALDLIQQGNLPPKRLFGAVQAMEEAMFMGDLSFWRSLEELTFNIAPLIRGLPDPFRSSMADEERRCYLDADLILTETGRTVLGGDADHAALNRIDRWLGGTSVTSEALWRWDRKTEHLLPPG